MRPDRGPRVWCGGCGTWASARGAAAASGVHLVAGRRCGAWQRPPKPPEAVAAHAALRAQAAVRPNHAARQALRKAARAAAAQRSQAAAATLRAEMAAAAVAGPDPVTDAPAPGTVRL